MSTVREKLIAARPSGCAGEMTPERVVYFLERFKNEEKMLGPHEQWALAYSISAITALKYWIHGTEIIESCLTRAAAGKPEDAPFPLVGDEANLWHQAQMNAFRHALEMMGYTTELPAIAAQPVTP